MTSERMRRQLERLLDEAEAAVTADDWPSVANKARAALALEPDNDDAAAFLKMAQANLDAGSAAPSPAFPPVERPGEGTPRTPAAEQPTSFAGGRYEVRRFLGEGGKKRVFLAHDSLLDRDVAFALIKADGLDATGRERITREAQAMGRLGAHPHIVSVFDLGQHDGQPFIVTELMGGGDVEGLLEKAGGALPVPQALEVAKAVCRGLAFAHANNVVHRDLKPGNVWLTHDGTAKIGDFGLAVALDRSRLTTHGLMVGTVAYMPPEQALGGDVTPQADLYSLGAMLYELVAGKPPFAGSEPTAIISQHINTPPVAPSWLTEDCPPALETLILQLLAKSPADRPVSAQAVLDALALIDPSQKSARHSDGHLLERLAHGVFVGREKELERLRKAFDDAFSGRGSLVMLVGEPGIGKTRTAQELETYARMRGALVLWGRAHEEAGAPPFWPFIQAGRAWGAAFDVASLRPALDGALAELARLFPELRRQPGLPEPEPVNDPQAAQFRLFDAYASFIGAVAAGSPLVLVLDDLHWADKPSLLLLQHLARDLARSRILVLATYRDTELARTHPLSEALASLNREPGFLRLPLRGLSREEVAAYIRSAARVDAKSVIVERIFEETEGNPFFLAEVVNLLTQEGTLDRDSLSDIAIPDGVKEALGRRLDRVSPEANALLQVCAIAGREFSYDTLTLLGERDEDQLLRLLEEALEARVVEEMAEPGRYRFTHALMQETLLSELSTTRRVRLHGQVGEALERRWGDRAGERASRLARHFAESATLTAGHTEKAIRYSRLAGEQAEEQFGWEEAQRHYENALNLSELTGAAAAELLHAHGAAATRATDYRAAWRSFMRALAIHREAGERVAFARVVLDAITVPAPLDRLRQAIDEALAARDEIPQELEARILIVAAGFPAWRTMSEAEVARLSEAARTTRLPDLEAGLLRHNADAAGLAFRFAEAVALALQAVEKFDEAGLESAAGSALNQACQWAWADGDLERTASLLRDAAARGARQRLPFYIGEAHKHLAFLHFLRGDRAGFAEHAAQIPPGMSGAWLCGALEAETSGNLPAAVALLPDLKASRDVASTFLELGYAARVLLAAGLVDQAREVVESVPEPAPGGGPYNGFASFMAEALAHVGPVPLVQRVYRYLRDDAGGFRFNLRTPAFGLDKHRGALALRLGLLEEAEQHYRTGLDWATRERCPIEVGRCRQGLAEIAERRGEHAAAMEHLERAGELFAGCGAKLYLDQVLDKKEILRA